MQIGTIDFALGFGQLFIIRRDNNNTHTPHPYAGSREKTFTPVRPGASMPFPY